MLRLIYHWCRRRAQKTNSFKLPPDRKGHASGRVNLGSYLSQTSVRGRTFDRFDLPRKRRKSLAIVLTILLALLLGWIVIESIAALELFRN